MRKRYGVRKTLGVLLGVSLTLGGLALPAKADDTDNVPQTIKMPVSIYDHLNDGLLFEYPLDGGAAEGQLGEDLSLDTNIWDKIDASAGVKYFDENGWKPSDLIADRLSDKKTPVYTKATVTKVAEIVKALMDSGYNGGKDVDEEGKANNKVYNRLYKQMTGLDYGTKGSEETLLKTEDEFKAAMDAVNEENTKPLTYQEMGWILKDKDGNNIGEPGEEKAWVNDGENLKSQEIGATAVFDFGTLQPGSYTFQYWSLAGMQAILNYGESGLQDITSSGNTPISFNLTAEGSVSIEFTANAEEANFVHGAGEDYALKDSQGNTIKAHITNPATYLPRPEQKTLQLSDYNVYEEEPGQTKWVVGSYGIESGQKYDPAAGTIYMEQMVTPGKRYELAYWNEGCKIKVSAGEKPLAELGVTYGEENNERILAQTQTFTVPADVNQIKIEIIQDPDYQDGTYYLVRDMKLTQIPGEVELGTYEESKKKFSDSKKNSEDIKTSMDYAYYMLNNFWSSTGDDITKKTANYTSLTLTRNPDREGNYYEIDQNNLVYDLTNKTIYKDPNASQSMGFFPLDAATDLNDGRFGLADGAMEFEGSLHNYHFATKAHTQFVYEEGMTFTFDGDDDVYLFINGTKVLDLGGAHSRQGATVNLDEVAKQLRLKEGEVYDMDFFHLERHAWASNFSITTNVTFNEPKASCAVEFTDKDGNLLGEEEEVQWGDEIGIKYSVTAESKGTNDEPWMTSVSLIDDPLGVKITNEGIYLNEGVYVKDELIAEVVDEDGNLVLDKEGNPEKVSISAKNLEDSEKVQEFIGKISALKVDKGQSIVISGLYKKVGTELIQSELEAKLDVKMYRYNDETGNLDEVTETASTTAALTVIPKNEPKAELQVILTDKDGKELPAAVPENTKVYVEYTLTARSNEMKGISLTDKGTGIQISKDGIVLPEGYEADDNVVITLTKDGEEPVELTFTKEMLANGIAAFDAESDEAWVLDNGDSIQITGIYTTLTKENPSVKSEVTAEVKGIVFNYNEESKELSVGYESPDLTADAEVKLETPAEPENPTKPEDPTKPENPENPTKPSNPAKPGNPENPTKPSNPAKPADQANQGNNSKTAGNKAGSTVVKTGDTTNIALYVVLLLISFGAIAGSKRYILKKK